MIDQTNHIIVAFADSADPGEIANKIKLIPGVLSTEMNVTNLDDWLTEGLQSSVPRAVLSWDLLQIGVLIARLQGAYVEVNKLTCKTCGRNSIKPFYDMYRAAICGDCTYDLTH